MAHLQFAGLQNSRAAPREPGSRGRPASARAPDGRHAATVGDVFRTTHKSAREVSELLAEQTLRYGDARSSSTKCVMQRRRASPSCMSEPG